jgi:hypothetical protein
MLPWIIKRMPGNIPAEESRTHHQAIWPTGDQPLSRNAQRFACVLNPHPGLSIETIFVFQVVL